MTLVTWQASVVFILSSVYLSPCQSFVIVPTSPFSRHNGCTPKSQDAMSHRRSSLTSLRSTATDRNLLMQDLLSAARNVGQVGSLASEQDQEMLVSLAQKLKNASDPKPARRKLAGVHALVYSASPGGSSGRLVGSIYGKVQQTFLDNDDGTFINSVELGPLKIALRATCSVKNDTTNIVKFQETTVSLFGQTVIQKEVRGGGTWNYIFMGQVEDTDGTQKLIRVMETPSLFILEQAL